MNDDDTKTINGKLDKILQAQATQAGICSAARERLEQVCETVYGNGRDGLVREVEQLKTVREIGGKGFWAIVALVSSVVSGTILALGGTLLAWINQ